MRTQMSTRTRDARFLDPKREKQSFLNSLSTKFFSKLSAMPTISIPVPTTALVVPTSPVSPSRETRKIVGLVPIELMNGCTEEHCVIESDNHLLTNKIRRHFLEHFGHRNLEAIVSEYAPDAVMVKVTNGERTSFHGREHIREAYSDIFELHPTVTSCFSLRRIAVDGHNGLAEWEASTPTHIFSECSDTFVFNDAGQICKQFIASKCTKLDTPWYVNK